MARNARFLIDGLASLLDIMENDWKLPVAEGGDKGVALTASSKEVALRLGTPCQRHGWKLKAFLVWLGVDYTADRLGHGSKMMGRFATVRKRMGRVKKVGCTLSNTFQFKVGIGSSVLYDGSGFG